MTRSGIDTSTFDRAKKPGDDLFRHVNGTWLDSYEIPEQIRDAVHRRIPVEAFPYSSRTSSSLDLDHVARYRFGHLWEPGQTSVAGLAPLSRLVHRAKTLGAWKLQNLGRAEFQWTSPLGHTYLVGPRGARPPESMIRRR